MCPVLFKGLGVYQCAESKKISTLMKFIFNNGEASRNQ